MPANDALLPLGHPPRDMWNGAVLALARNGAQANFLPLAGLQQPLIRGSCDGAAVEEMWPDDVDGLY